MRSIGIIMKNDIKNVKTIVFGVLVAVLLWVAMIVVDVQRTIVQHSHPVFCIETVQADHCKEYIGIGYSFSVKGLHFNRNGDEKNRYSEFLLLGHKLVTSFSGVGISWVGG